VGAFIEAPDATTMRDEARPVTSVEFLDAAVWREIGSEEPQPPAVFIVALSRLVGRWLLMRSESPDIDLLTVMCRARGYIERRCGSGATQTVIPRGSGPEDDGCRLTG
jgi:hypothetical protein